MIVAIFNFFFSLKYSNSLILRQCYIIVWCRVYRWKGCLNKADPSESFLRKAILNHSTVADVYHDFGELILFESLSVSASSPYRCILKISSALEIIKTIHLSRSPWRRCSYINFGNSHFFSRSGLSLLPLSQLNIPEQCDTESLFVIQQLFYPLRWMILRGSVSLILVLHKMSCTNKIWLNGSCHIPLLFLFFWKRWYLGKVVNTFFRQKL